MDKAKGMLKGGWHPPGDRQIKRETWKSDLKGLATGKKKDPYEEQRNHSSAPLSSLRDPDSFGPPPKHREYYGADGQAINPATPGTVSRVGTGTSSLSGRPSPGLGGPLVETGYAERRRQEAAQREAQEQAELDAQKRKGQPYRADTSGLKTDHLPKPPARRTTDADSPVAGPGRTASPVLPPSAAPRQTTGTTRAPAPPPAASSGPPPVLPPRQNEYPDEHAPPPPPTYNEALNAPSPQQNFASMAQGVASRFGQSSSSGTSFPARQQTENPANTNQGAMSRLGQAGISVPGFGIGSNGNTTTPSAQQIHGAATVAQGAAQRFGQPGNGAQLGELQQRFARMNAGSANEPGSPQAPGGMAAAAQKKPPPPPPPKKATLSAASSSQPGDASASSAPPPIPTSSKPRP